MCSHLHTLNEQNICLHTFLFSWSYTTGIAGVLCVLSQELLEIKNLEFGIQEHICT